MSNELKTEKFGFMDRVKMAFGAKGLIEHANEVIAEAQKKIAELEQRNGELTHREATVQEQEKTVEMEKRHAEFAKQEAKDKIAEAQAMMKEAQEMKKEAESMMKRSEEIVQQAQSDKDVAIAMANQRAQEKISSMVTESKEAGEITEGKGEKGANMTLFFKKQIIGEKVKLETTLKELEEIGATKEQKEEIVQIYQAKLLGILYAYTDYDRLTSPEALAIIKQQVEGSILSISMSSEELRTSLQTGFVDGYMHTRYSNSHYQDYDWVKYVERNKDFFNGHGMFITPEQDGRVRQSYYTVRKDFSDVGSQLTEREPADNRNGESVRPESSYSVDLKKQLKEAGYDMDKILSSQDDGER